MNYRIVYTSRSCEREILQVLLEKLTSSLQKAIQSMHGDYISSEPITRPSILVICSNARSHLKDYLSTDSWSSMEGYLCSVLSELDRFDELSTRGDSSELDLLLVLSSARLHIGLAQSCLLCPSPIDPIVAARTEHKCLQQQVRTALKISY